MTVLVPSTHRFQAHRFQGFCFQALFLVQFFILAILITANAMAAPIADSPGKENLAPGPNFKQAQLYSPEYLGQRIYTTSVNPNWIGKTDRFWYSYRTSAGTHYYLVDPTAATKVDLFDHQKLASDLSQALKKPLDAESLTLSNSKIDDEGEKLTFIMEKSKFELDLSGGELTHLGEASKEELNRRSSRFSRRGSSSRSSSDSKEKDPRAHRNFSPDRTAYLFIQDYNLFYVEASAETQEEIKAIDERMKKEEAEKKAKEKAGTTEEKSSEEGEKQKDSEGEKSDVKESVENKTDEKNSRERKSEEEKSEEEDSDEKKSEGKTTDEKKPEKKVDERERWADAIDESQALQLTDDGVEKYEFSQRRSSRRGSEAQLEDDELIELLQAGEYEAFLGDDEETEEKEEKEKEEEESEEEEKPKTRPSINWAPDSTAFYVSRRDSRDVAELYLVNSLSQPRPTLEKYSYSLPGEEKISTTEIHIFDRSRKSLFRVEKKWIDESYQNIHWPRTPYKDPDAEESAEEPDPAGSGDEIRLIRRDRLLRNIELCSFDVRTGEFEVLFDEGFVGANISPKSIRYLKKRNEMIWWSERSGWGHFYLYGIDGEFKNAITQGAFRASQIVDVDEDKGILYFKGNAREAGENLYFQHLYRVFLDGSGLTLMDPGNANHRSVLSPTKNFILDNCSRIDMAPISVLCDADGKEVMKLEEADLSRLRGSGWKMPETFTFKAADGITDLYGNMWKPFDFDPTKKYPVVSEVYPGPQTEGVSHTFSASNGRQQLAQIGFIVVQLGHRGGTPGRSKAYHSYGYFNLRDYGLADKKAGLEQLAERFPFIDIERVGIYGHSGGGFMTAAALLQEPYNDFFKVGVASSGNHDNNVYGRHWAERYHGLKEVAVKEKKQKEDEKQEKSETTSAYLDDDEQKKDEVEKKEEKQEEKKKETEEESEKIQFEIHVPTNAELAENLKGKLLLVHGDMDNNVHPAGTMRLVDALIKANKRFDLLILPGKRHGFGEYSRYFTQRKWEFFAEHLLGDHQSGADILEKD